MRPERVRGLAWVLLLVSLAVRADPALDGDLGQWLDDAVAPALAESLSQHPRFQGQTIRLATVTPDSAARTSHALAEALSRRLRQRLLGVAGVRLAVAEPRRSCGVPQPVDYLVQIEVAAVESHSARVHVGVIDLAESVWVSGISHQWQGRLSTAERQAMARPVSRGAPGSAANPLPLAQAQQIAEALTSDLSCLLPRDLEGSLFVDDQPGGSLSGIGAELRAALLVEPLVPVTPVPAGARWQLALQFDEAADGPRELTAVLTDSRDQRRQTVASVWVSGPTAQTPAAVAGVPDAGRVPDAARAQVPGDAAGLLTDLVVVRPDDSQCDMRQARTRACIDITFELLRPAYLFLLTTRHHEIADAPCDARLRRADAGPRRYRVRLPPGGVRTDPLTGELVNTRPDAGVYVLAVRDRGHASRLREVLAEAPGRCVAAAAGSLQGWLGRLDAELDRSGPAVDWRLLHLAHEGAGIVAL